MEEQNRFNEVLAYAANNRASDVHIKVGSPPIIRVDGELRDVGNEIYHPTETHTIVKMILSDEQYQHLIENGEIDFSYSLEGVGRFRVNAYKQRNSYCLAMRLVNVDIPSLKQLGIPESVSSLTELKSGLVLVTGPTGSGKSTTLASMIQCINDTRRCHILTLEDPIEYLFRNKKSIIGQREIGLDSNSFSTALRATLRQDPDIIFVGEMRDLETIEIALTAAETGHLVLSTLHTLGAAKTIDRIIDAFPSHNKEHIRVQVASLLQGAISQQLIPMKSGIGRVPACDIMIPSIGIRNLIRENKVHQILNTIQTGKQNGMITMDDSLKGLFKKGLISKEAAIEYAFDKEDLMKSISY
jgi:twitching motility protein PilT